MTKQSRILAGVILGLSLVTASQARADITTRVKSISLSAEPAGIYENLVVVPHDGNDWVEPAQAARRVDFTMSVNAETTRSKYKIDLALAGLTFQGNTGNNLTVWPESQMAVLWQGSADELGPTDFNYAYLFNGMRARNTCRQNYTQLRGEGLAHEDIVSEDRTVTQNDELHFAIRTKDTSEFQEGDPPREQDDGSFVHPGHWVWTSSWETVLVKCLKKPEAPEQEMSELQKDEEDPVQPRVDDLTLAFDVQKIDLYLSPKTQSGVCPMDLTLQVDVFATAAGVAKVRALTSGSFSPELEVPVVAHNSGHFIGRKIFHATVGKSGKGGFTAGDKPSGGGLNLAIASDDNVHDGVYWIEASNGVKSNYEGFKVTCTPPPFEPGLKTEPGTTPPTGPAGVKADLGQPDLMATTLGMSLAGGVHAWGTSVVLNNPALAAATGMGRNRNMCRFSPAAFRPFNKGTVASGPFKTTVYRNNKQVRTTTFNLPAQSGLPGNGWYKFDLDLAQGMNVIKVELDSNETVGESDEGNNDYTLRVRVNFPCGKAGDTLKTPSGEPTPERPRKPRPTPPTTTIPTTPSQSE